MLDLGQDAKNKKRVVPLDTLSLDALVYLLESMTGVTYKGDLEKGRLEMKEVRVLENAKEIDEMYQFKRKGQGKSTMTIGALSRAQTVVLKPGQALDIKGEEYKSHLGLYVQTQREVEHANALFAADQVMMTQFLVKSDTPKTILLDRQGYFFPAQKMLQDDSELIRKWHERCAGSFEAIAQRKALYEIMMENPVVHHFQLPTLLSKERDFIKMVTNRQQPTKLEQELIVKYKIKQQMCGFKFAKSEITDIPKKEVDEKVLYASIAKHRNVRGADTNRIAPICRLAYTGEVPVQYTRNLIKAWRLIAIAQRFGNSMIRKSDFSDQVWGFVGQQCMVHDDTLIPKDTYEEYVKNFKGTKDEICDKLTYERGVANYSKFPGFKPILLIQSAAQRPDMVNAGFNRGKDRDAFIAQIVAHIKGNDRVIYSIYGLKEDFDREWAVLPDPVSHNGQILVMKGKRSSYTYSDFCYRVLRQNQLITMYPMTRQVIWHKYDNMFAYASIILPLRTKQTDEEVLEIDEEASRLVGVAFKQIECKEDVFELVYEADNSADDEGLGGREAQSGEEEEEKEGDQEEEVDDEEDGNWYDPNASGKKVAKVAPKGKIKKKEKEEEVKVPSVNQLIPEDTPIDENELDNE
jgi:hypothetical protein